jgi:hypothetical protein
MIILFLDSWTLRAFQLYDIAKRLVKAACLFCSLMASVGDYPVKLEDHLIGVCHICPGI